MLNRWARGGVWQAAAVAAWVGCWGLVAPAAARPPAAKLLPQYTGVFVSVASVPELVERFGNTSLGHMSRDPQLRPLIRQVYGAVGEAMTKVRDELGLSLDEMLKIPQGEITFAMVCPEGLQPQMFLLVDVGDEVGAAKRLLAKLEEFQKRKNVPRTEKTINGTTVVLYERDRLLFFEKDNTICLGGNMRQTEEVEKLLAAWNGGEADTLAENPRFAAVASRCRGSKDVEPQILAYVDPILLFEASARAAPGGGGTGAQIALAMLPTLGLDGRKGVGASITMDAGPYDSIMQAHLLLDNPRTGVLEVIACEPGDFVPEPWAPADVANYSTLHWNFRRSVDKIAALYDSFTGQGAFETTVAGSFTKVMKIDFYKDFLDQLDGRVSLIQCIEEPITLTSQQTLAAVRMKDPKPLWEALERELAKQERVWKKQSYAGQTYYEFSMRRPDGEPIPEAMPQPHFSVGLLDNYLLLSNQPGVIRRVILASADPSKSLGNEPDFQLIAGKIQRLAGTTKPSWIGFDRPEESFRFLYGLATADRTREMLRRGAEGNPFLKSLDAALEQNPLPPFAVLARYLAPSGMFMIDDETGLHYTAFSLRRKLD